MEKPNTKDGLTFVNYIGTWRSDGSDANPTNPQNKTPEEMLERLFDMVYHFTLDPTFERYGDFVSRNPRLVRGGRGDYTALFGNFYDYSFVFNIETKDEKLIARFANAVAENKKKESYQRAKVIRARQEEEREVYYRNGCKTLERQHFEREMDNSRSV